MGSEAEQKTPVSDTNAFEFVNGSSDNIDNYSARFVDFGKAGIKLEIFRPNAPFWDRIAALMLDTNDIDSFMRWLAKTAGRPSMVLPDETLAILKGLLAYVKDSNEVPKSDKRILRQAITSLTNLYSVSSLAGRAISR